MKRRCLPARFDCLPVQVALVVLMFLGSNGTAVAGEVYSELWGKKGEKWQPDSRLPDFSFAGYHSGETELPRPAVTMDVVKNFGAKGDGTTDDTAAFKKALASITSGVLFVPKGRYVISDILWIEKSNVVIRGAGPGDTVLYVTKNLEDVRPNPGETTSGKKTSNYSWSGGFLWVKGSVRSRELSSLQGGVKRGGSLITTAQPTEVKPGQLVQVTVAEDARRSLIDYVYSGDTGKISQVPNDFTIGFVAKVVQSKNKAITIERPLLWDLRNEWKPTLTTFEPTVQEVGIEDLAIEFPTSDYQGHFSERGKNGIAMSGVANCWIRNVRLTNCDSGIFFSGTFCTVDGLVIDGQRKPKGGDTGHHGVTLGNDCLLQNFTISTKFVHDITFTNFQHGNVVKNGSGSNLSLDHHRRGPFENLVTNVDVGDGNQVWRSGGGDGLGKHCAARGIFWCIRSKVPLTYPTSEWAPNSIALVGINTKEVSITEANGKWLEAINPEHLVPQDLHAAQLQRRLKGGR